MIDDASFRKALLNLVKEDFDDEAVEIVSYQDGGYQSHPANYCSFGTCYDEDWVTEVIIIDIHGDEYSYNVVGSLPELLAKLTA
jgi:hypothetical protein